MISSKTETEIKKDCIKVLAKLKIFNFAVPAGYFSKRGLPDRICHYKGKVIYLEFKNLKGKQSPDQIIFEQQCKADKIPYYIIRSVEDLNKFL